jgi:hypothetical protein
MCVIADKKKQGKRKRPKARTIVDYPGVSCLCALRQCLYGGKKDEILKKQRCHNLLLGYEGSFFQNPDITNGHTKNEVTMPEKMK